MSIESENDLNEYMKTLLDFDNSQHKGFFLELCKKKFPSRGNLPIFIYSFTHCTKYNAKYNNLLQNIILLIYLLLRNVVTLESSS